MVGKKSSLKRIKLNLKINNYINYDNIKIIKKN